MDQLLSSLDDQVEEAAPGLGLANGVLLALLLWTAVGGGLLLLLR